MATPLRIAALVKQIPKIEALTLGPDGRLQRDGLELHMNDYCRRAVAKGHELAAETGGSLTVITLGPPSAENVLREAIAFGADRGVHITDPAFAGSDTWATAKALSRAIEVLGGFDLVLLGRNSVDADTGQVPPQIAQFLGLPFATGAREIMLEGDLLRMRLEHDDEWVDVEVALPAMVSCAERLCDPCKIKDPDVWAMVDAAKISRLTARDLGEGPWGQAGSPTRVGAVRAIDVTRANVVASGSLEAQIDTVMRVLAERDAFDLRGFDQSAEIVAGDGVIRGAAVVVTIEPSRTQVTRELLGEAASLASAIGGHVVAFGPAPGDEHRLAAWGADLIVALPADAIEEDIATALRTWSTSHDLWAIVGPSTAWGREVLSRVACELNAGLTGDAVELEARDGRLIAWKPAFGGKLLVEILCSSPLQMATVRAGVLPSRTPRAINDARTTALAHTPRSRVRIIGKEREDDSEELANAPVVIGVGMGVKPADYDALDALRKQLGGVYCATRKVTDKGWMPRARQVGITGHSISPKLFISIGASGKFNHTVGVRSAGTIIGINTDPEAMIFQWSDVGIVGDWHEVLEALTPRLSAALKR